MPASTARARLVMPGDGRSLRVPAALQGGMPGKGSRWQADRLSWPCAPPIRVSRTEHIQFRPVVSLLFLMCLPLLTDRPLHSLLGLTPLHFEAGSMLSIFHWPLHTMNHELQVQIHGVGMRSHMGGAVASQAAGVPSCPVNFQAELALEPLQLQCQAALAVALELRSVWRQQSAEFLVHLNPLTSLFGQQVASVTQLVLCICATCWPVWVVLKGCF